MYHDKDLKVFTPIQKGTDPGKPMAHRRRTPPVSEPKTKPPDRSPVPILVFLFIMAVITCLALGLLARGIKASSSYAQLSAQMSTQTMTIDTLTPRPTEYPTSTREYPTVSPTATVSPNVEIVQKEYVTVPVMHTLEVTRIVTVVVTKVADPKPTPDARATQAERDSLVEYRNANLLTFGYGFGGFVLGWVIVLGCVGSLLTMIDNRKPTLAGTTQSAEEILSPKMYDEDDLKIAFYMGNREHTKSNIAIRVFSVSGGNRIPRVEKIGDVLSAADLLEQWPPGEREVVR